MYIGKLIKAYNRNFSFYKRLKLSVNESHLMKVFLGLIVLSSIGFYVLFNVDKSHYFKVWYMVVCIILYIGSIIASALMQVKVLKNEYGSLQNYEEDKLRKIEHSIKEMFEYDEIGQEQYNLLESLIAKEIETINDNKKFPLSNTIKQLFISLFITGLLSYSFREIISGNIEVGYRLLTLYLMILGTIIMIGTIAYIMKEYTKEHKLKQICKLIKELQLRASFLKVEE